MLALIDNSCHELNLFIVMLILSKIKANIEDFSSYKRMDLYKLESSYPSQFCPGFLCEKSGLSQVRVAQLLDKENQIRNDYAKSKSISNVYYVGWSHHLALFARRKALLCLFPTDENNVIYETGVFDEWFEADRLTKFPKPVAVEVVMGYRVMKIGSTTALYLYDELEDDLGDFFREGKFNVPTAIRRRGSVTGMGCDYVVRNNKTHILTHLVCVYGLLYFSDSISNDYSAIVGTPCSNCVFYRERPYFRQENKKHQQWGCLSKFAYLCGDLVLPINLPWEFRYHCGTKTTTPDIGKEELVTSKNSEDELPTTIVSPPYDWPCFKYAIPVISLISIMVIVVCYQFFSVTLWKPNLN